MAEEPYAYKVNLKLAQTPSSSSQGEAIIYSRNISNIKPINSLCALDEEILCNTKLNGKDGLQKGVHLIQLLEQAH